MPPVVRARPEWPSLVTIDATRLPTGGAATGLTFAGPLAADEVLRELARLSVPASTQPLPGGPTAAGPDPASLNPIGFRPDATEPLADLSCDADAVLLAIGDIRHDLTAGATSSVVEALRGRLGIRVRWEPVTPALARAVSGLAMAGIPAVSDTPPPTAVRDALGADLHAALASLSGDGAALEDVVRREEASILLRRAALTHHAPAGARGGSRFPACTALLATRRPEQLDFALRQVARQRGPEVELVVVGHGFEPDAARVRDLLGGRAHQVLSRPAEAVFGDVLDAAVEAASGEVVVKMDDDDWYGPDFLGDLLLAREYSGADVVGAPAEFVYLHQLDRTVRTRAGGEQFARLVAGGTIALPRELLHDLGGFRPVRRFVDRQLLAAAGAAGLRIYRGHGLGYLLRRTSSGHTWDPGLDFFVDPARVAQQWEGFAPTAVHDVDALDTPGEGGRQT